MRIIPDSWGAAFMEANDCHTPAGQPAGGRFCSKSGSSNPYAQKVRPGQDFDIMVAVGLTASPAPRLHRRFLFNPTTGEMVLGGATGFAGRDQSHAEAFAAAGEPAKRYDAFTVHGWLLKDEDKPYPLVVEVTRVAGPRGRMVEFEPETMDALFAWGERLVSMQAPKSAGWRMGTSFSTIGRTFPELFRRQRRAA